MHDPRTDMALSARPEFNSAGVMAVGTRPGKAVEPPPALFEPEGRDGVGVYLIKRDAIAYAERTKGEFECYTITNKADGAFITVAVRETGLMGKSGPLRFFCEDVKPACYNGIAPDGSQPSCKFTRKIYAPIPALGWSTSSCA